MQEDQEKMQKESELIFKLKENTVQNTGLITKIFEINDESKKYSENYYQRELMFNKRDHLFEIENMKE